MGNSDLDGMGGFLAVAVVLVVFIWAMLRDSDRKIKKNTEAQKNAQQQAASNQFKRDFGTNQQFDSSDFYIANRVVDYAKAGGDQLETITNVAGLFGTVKSVVARESSQATAKLIKDQIEQNRQNREIPLPQNQIPKQPVYLHPQHPERPVVIEQPRRRRVFYDDPVYDDDEYEYMPRRRRFYNYHS